MTDAELATAIATGQRDVADGPERRQVARALDYLLALRRQRRHGRPRPSCARMSNSCG
jgi:hypothetical protein